MNERYGHFSKDLNTFSNSVFQNNRNTKVLKEKTKQMDGNERLHFFGSFKIACLANLNMFVCFPLKDMLKGVWSVRKDVRVNNPVKASDVSQKSYYSRYNMSKGSVHN